MLGYKLGEFNNFYAGSGHLPMRGMSWGSTSADAAEKRKWVQGIPDCFETIKKGERGYKKAEFENKQRLKVAEYVYEAFVKQGMEFSTEPKNAEHTARISKVTGKKEEQSDRYSVREYCVVNYCASPESKRATEKRWKSNNLKGKPLYVKSSSMGVHIFLNGYLSGTIALKLMVERHKNGSIKRFVHTDDFRFFNNRGIEV